MKILLTVSLILNVLLAGWWFKQKSAGSNLATASTPVTQSAAPVTPAATPAPAVTRLPQFANTNWMDIQTDDLRELIKRLRADGCPDETFQNIVLANVNRRYAPRIRKVLPEDVVNRPYWEAEKRDPASLKEKADRWKRYREETLALDEEKSNLLVKLLGVDPEKERLNAEDLADSDDWKLGRFAFVPESKRPEAVKILDSFTDKLNDFYAQTGNNWDAKARAGLRKLEDEKHNALVGVLSPSELREYELRESPTALQLIGELHGVPVTRGEYEALYDIRQKYGDSVWIDTSDDATKRIQVEENQKAMKSDMSFALGADKAAEIQRADDPAYQQLVSYTRHFQLPPTTATKVYALKLKAEHDAQDIRANGALDPEERSAALQKLRAQTEASVKNALGEKAFKRFMSRGNGWLQSLSAN